MILVDAAVSIFRLRFPVDQTNSGMLDPAASTNRSDEQNRNYLTPLKMEH